MKHLAIIGCSFLASLTLLADPPPRFATLTNGTPSAVTNYMVVDGVEHFTITVGATNALEIKEGEIVEVLTLKHANFEMSPTLQCFRSGQIFDNVERGDFFQGPVRLALVHQGGYIDFYPPAIPTPASLVTVRIHTQTPR